MAEADMADMADMEGTADMEDMEGTADMEAGMVSREVGDTVDGVVGAAGVEADTMATHCLCILHQF